MKKLADWFLNQTRGAKISLVALVVLGIAGLIITITSMIPSGEPEPEPTVTVPVVTPEPSTPPEETSDPTEEMPEESEEGDDVGLDIVIPPNAPFTIDQWYDLQITEGNNAVMEECSITYGETLEQRQSRLNKYFSPNSVTYTETPVPFVENRICSNPTFTLISLDKERFTVSFSVALTTFTTFVDSEEEKQAIQERAVFQHEAQFIDGKWVIIT